ncbi:hypothetical protein GGQ99_005104 [Aminobacter niigataensis]|uniref:Uncharacterized protein n=1 Tax=Aminobacter niigataensis TaxID=83265 RepID=A0ABR6L925_9HYPH|nr:hypothetical protein [Aminobacter niigataensis]
MVCPSKLRAGFDAEVETLAKSSRRAPRRHQIKTALDTAPPPKGREPHSSRSLDAGQSHVIHLLPSINTPNSRRILTPVQFTGPQDAAHTSARPISSGVAEPVVSFGQWALAYPASNSASDGSDRTATATLFSSSVIAVSFCFAGQPIVGMSGTPGGVTAIGDTKDTGTAAHVTATERRVLCCEPGLEDGGGDCRSSGTGKVIMDAKASQLLLDLI